MVKGMLLLGVLLAMPAWSAESARKISADEWARPRSGDSLVGMPALAETVRDYQSQLNRRIVIRHPRGEEGVIWAEELRGWLVALGVPSTDIALEPELTLLDTVELDVSAGGE